MGLELINEFFEFYRMDYTNNVFVNEANFKGESSREELGNLYG